MRPTVPGEGSVLTTIFRGRRLAYEVVDGMAVHGGDIVLRTAEAEAAGSTRSGRLTGRRIAHSQAPRSFSAVDSEKNLWPDGIIPYEIDPAVYENRPEQRKDIEDAIQFWNRLTVIRLIERNGEADYVRIVRTAGTRCLSEVGMTGGEQRIAIAVDGCGPTGIIHAIGHTVGLWHEHQREDRDEYIALIDENLSIREYRTQWENNSPALGPYNFASTMHHGLHVKAPRFSTIPSGIPISARGLSAGDINAVAHLYGKTPRAITVSTNPPGLMVIVDGLEAISPIKVVLKEGTTHSIEAPLMQASDSGGASHVFGKWSDSTERIRQVEASRESTWYEANYYQQRIPLDVSPPQVDSLPPQVDLLTFGDPFGADGPPSAGPGTGGGIGARPDGRGTGVGSGAGSGVGPGSGGGIGGGVFRIGDGVTSPKLLYRVEPNYTQIARKHGLQGRVILVVEIWEDGRAHNIRVVRGLGLGLDEKAVEAIEKWKFEPSKKGGKPVRVAATIQVTFRLL